VADRTRVLEGPNSENEKGSVRGDEVAKLVDELARLT